MISSREVDNKLKVFAANTWTSIPARITNIPEGNPTKVFVRPVLRRLLRGAESQEYPEVREVPIVFPGSSQALLRLPLKVGDWVLVVFSGRPIQNWLNGDGEIVNPETFQKMDYNSAIAIPGLFPFKANVGQSSKHTLADDYGDTVLKSNVGTASENEIRLKADGSVEVSATTGAKITMTAAGEITIDGNLTVTGSITATDDISSTGGDVISSANSLNTHLHTSAAPGDPTSTPYTPPSPPPTP